MFPHYNGKYTKRPSLSPQYFVKGNKVKLPDMAVLVYSSRIMRKLIKIFGGTRVASYKDKMFNSLGVYLSRSSGLAIVYLPIGAPITGIATEELISKGVKHFLIVGFAGSLKDEIGHGNVIVCSKAIRDEGVSHHYARESMYAYPTKEFTRDIIKSMKREGMKFMVGPSWTIDTPYMETVDEIGHYSKRGVLTVEMESAALFAIVDRYRRKGMKIEAGAIFIISDIVTKDIKEYEFVDTKKGFGGNKYFIRERVEGIASVIKDLKKGRIH
ncbi:MAG: nucleoside phosphorylase [Candidatus Micrarchaeia archaeon]